MVWAAIGTFALSAGLLAQSRIPAEAMVIERDSIPGSIRANRELVLWMVSPERHDRGPFSVSDNPYVCPESTAGSYLRGHAKISLIDAATGYVINTVSLRSKMEDSFKIPYRILPDPGYYLVPNGKRGVEGKPALLRLRDLNGDGLQLETAFFEAVGCMGLFTTSIGYSPARDRVIQYEIELQIIEQEIIASREIRNRGTPRMETSVWADYLFSERPVSPGRWMYKIDYTGRGGSLNSYEVVYDSAEERFRGTVVVLAPAGAWR